jgi:pimeloyl-ACP methyl ester carboxylesterase
MTGRQAAEKGFAASQDGVPIAFESHGMGEPALVLIHGWSCNRSYWAAQVEPLSEHLRVVALDLAGHGQSGTAREAWTIDSFGRDVAAVVGAVGAGRVVLVGHSMGGNVAAAAAIHLGERVQALVWVDSYRKLGSPRSLEEIDALLAPFKADFEAHTRSYVRGMFPTDADEGLVKRVAEDMSKAPPAIAVPALESSLAFGRTITPRLEELHSPVVAINAQAPPADVESLRSHGVETLTMPGVGHFPMMEAPDAFNALLMRALSKVGTAPVLT